MKTGRPRIGRKKMKVVAITVDPDVYRKWRKYCRENDLNGSQEIRGFIEEEVVNYEKASSS